MLWQFCKLLAFDQLVTFQLTGVSRVNLWNFIPLMCFRQSVLCRDRVGGYIQLIGLFGENPLNYKVCSNFGLLPHIKSYLQVLNLYLSFCTCTHLVKMCIVKRMTEFSIKAEWQRFIDFQWNHILMTICKCLTDICCPK